MKTTRLFISQLVAVVMLTGCISTSNFQAWDGPTEFEGQGGAFTTKDGIDIYTAGAPKKKCRVLGVINTSTMSSAGMMVLMGDSWSASKLVKEAKARGGNAIIVVTDKRQILGWSSSGSATAFQTGNTATAYGSSGTSLHVSRDRVAILVKYVGDVQEQNPADLAAMQKLIGHWVSESFAGKDVSAQQAEITFLPDKKLIARSLWTKGQTINTNSIEGTYYVRNDKLFMALPGEAAGAAIYYIVGDQLVIKPANMDVEGRFTKVQ